MTTKVYIVTSGSYSDYRINAVFSTKKLAEDYRQGYDFNEIEEWELDEPFYGLKPGERLYYIQMVKAGDVIYFRQETDRPEFVSRLYRDRYPPGTDQTILITHCAGTSEQHAVKIANERRARLIADGTWDQFDVSKEEIRDIE